MTVAEYIEHLKQMPQDAVVVAKDVGCGACAGDVYEEAPEPWAFMSYPLPNRDNLYTHNVTLIPPLTRAGERRLVVRVGLAA